MIIKIFSTNLVAYNRGELRGKWLTLPLPEDVLREEIRTILSTSYNDEEFFITDYEAPFFIEEYENVFELNSFMEELADIDEAEDIISAISEDVLGDGYDRDELLRILKDRDYYATTGIRTEQELALNIEDEMLPFDYALAEKAGASNYIDWEAVGREMTYDGWNITKDGIAIYVYR